MAVFTFLGLFLLVQSLVADRYKNSGAHLQSLKEDTQEHLFRLRRDIDDPSAVGAVKIRQFHVDSKIYSRFATVRIESEVVNTEADSSHEISFSVQAPETAFMSNFTMAVDGEVFIAKVLEKQEAQERYKQAKEQNQTAGQVKQTHVDPQRGMEVFTVNVNLAPGSSANFILTYNELLERRHGIYTQRLFLQPGGIVSNMTVSASFAEDQGFKAFSYMIPGSLVAQSSSSENLMYLASPTSRSLTFTPTEAMQRSFDPVKGIHGEFVITYDVSHKTGGGNIIVQNEHFVHYFSPPGLPPLPKNILFVIDISGSMSGDKIQQANSAMLSILSDLAEKFADRFNILLFDDNLEKWSSEPMLASEINTEKAKGYINEKLQARGSTNIHLALMTGLDMLLGDRVSHSCDTADMIVFLTDGDPTAGITNTKTIVEMVTNKNKGRASIFSLGFGFSMNFAFLSELSANNRGFARRIYAESDSAAQLENFYEEIGTPLLCDVAVVYSNEIVEENLLTGTQFPLYFEGKEIIVAGKTRAPAQQLDLSALDAQLEGTSSAGLQTYVVKEDSIAMVPENGVEADLTEKLWAYMYIKKLLKDMEKISSEEDKNATKQQALNMSLSYGFVTPLTSFSIVADVPSNAGDSHEMWDFVAGRMPNYFSPDMNGMNGHLMKDNNSSHLSGAWHHIILTLLAMVLFLQCLM